MSIRVIKTGIFESRGEIPELDSHGHLTGKWVENSAVIPRNVVLLDDLHRMLDTRRKINVAQGFHDRVDEIDVIMKEIAR